MKKHLWIVAVCLAAVCVFTVRAQEDKKDDKYFKAIPPGHSAHGEVFNEGPRQKAYLMGGTGRVHFAVTSKHPDVQKFVEQGVGQLHGFWYFEAERSFRQAATLDPDCAIAYWGMALANASGNQKRARGFSAEAVKRKAGASKHEQMYIDALDRFLNSKAGVADKAKKLAQSYASIAKRFPDDLEAQAFLGFVFYSHRALLKKSYEDVDGQLKKVLAKEPLHPAHHFVIHLWDYKTAANALESSALCGQGSPEIAHMWHMPGHIYSQLKRYPDAVWQQEASARVDHKHMIKDRLLPDQIHNFAHNNEWLIRNLVYIGRANDAIDLAKNMIELPRHPKYNTLTGRNSAFYGRLRLFEVLDRYELWSELIALAHSAYLEPTDVESEQINRLKYLGIACFRGGPATEGEVALKELQHRLQEAEAKAIQTAATKFQGANPKKAPPPGLTIASLRETTAATLLQTGSSKGDRASAGTNRRSERRMGTLTVAKGDRSGQFAQAARSKSKSTPRAPTAASLEQAIAAVQGHQALARKDYKTALNLLRKAGEDGLVLARVQCLAGEKEPAVQAARSYVNGHKNEVVPLAGMVEVLWLAGKTSDAGKSFEELRQLSGHIQLGAPVFARLDPIARELKLPADWRLPAQTAPDVGQRPNLDELGPFRWHPSPAPVWTLKDGTGSPHSLEEYRGKPVVVIFFLGYGCLHCAEQVKAFAKAAKKFDEAGIALIAVSTDDLDGLRVSQKNYKESTIPFPLVSDRSLDTFKAYRAFDDFENMPLHGTFLIDGNGLVRWQDIGYEPFMNTDFVLKEAHRLLGVRTK